MSELTHTCPGWCGRQVPNRLFACRDCWWALPRHLQRDVERTARMSLLQPDRRQAVHAARDWYRGQGSGMSRSQDQHRSS
jgi:hypothetical protein